jgi:hypothetical protein
MSAHRLARRVDIALPLWMEDRVVGFLRNQYLFGLLVTWLAVPPLVTVLTAQLTAHDNLRYWAARFPWMIAGMPLFWIATCLAVSAWPRWRASGASRVTHLRPRETVWQAFTRTERAALVLGLLMTAAVDALGLRQVHAAISWWVVCAAALAGSAGLCWHAAAVMMNRPSSASDILELGWDDLLKFHLVRGLVAVAAWMPVLVLAPIEAILRDALGHANGFSLVPEELDLVLVAALFLVFRQGRHRWRRACETRAPRTGTPVA